MACGDGVRGRVALWWQCPRCGRPLELRRVQRGSGDIVEVSFPKELISTRPATMWRYREALALSRDADVVSLGEGMTPLVALGGRDEALASLLLKLDYAMPSGSYKDRGASMLVSAAHELGINAAVEDSSGNAGAAMAAYCARAAIDIRIYAPLSTSTAKLTQIALHGASLHRVPGTRADTGRAVLDAARTTAYLSHNWNPFFIEGVKTVAFEICEQLGWRAPDNVLAPLGYGGIILGLYRGFCDLERAGVIERLPRIIGVQPASCNGLERAWAARWHEGEPQCNEPGDPPLPLSDDSSSTATTRTSCRYPSFVQTSDTLAEGIVAETPIRPLSILRAISHTKGTIVSVSDEQVVDGLQRLASSGIFVEPTSAVVVHGFLTCLNEHRLIQATDCTVAILSGSGLKASSKLAELFSSHSR